MDFSISNRREPHGIGLAEMEWQVRFIPSGKGQSRMDITTVGLDLAKDIITVCAVAAAGANARRAELCTTNLS